jgi:hypothetical protein
MKQKSFVLLTPDQLDSIVFTAVLRAIKIDKEYPLNKTCLRSQDNLKAASKQQKTKEVQHG